MKKMLLALSLMALTTTGSAFAAQDIINYTQVQPTVAEDGKRVVSLPDRKKTSRRRMLVDFGLFGAGVHIGWMKPRNVDVQQGNGGDAAVIKRRHGFGGPIFNVSAGTHALGLGTH